MAAQTDIIEGADVLVLTHSMISSMSLSVWALQLQVRLHRSKFNLVNNIADTTKIRVFIAAAIIVHVLGTCKFLIHTSRTYQQGDLWICSPSGIGHYRSRGVHYNNWFYCSR
ncbi:hypothetical protein EDB19DRAFT_93142 [Suillus lakei]|nr:hypothetical protein EDB19DRAFT_93142 [Suillus lakei]